jgi:hypothetical protein
VEPVTQAAEEFIFEGGDLMTQLKKRLLIAAGLAALALTGPLMDTTHNVAQAAGPSVTIDGPLPLPVNASQTGAWSVTANQGGAPWSVNINNTPGVNIANSPTVGLAAGASVHDADNPARQPYTAESGVFTTAAGGIVTYPAVPSGKVLVIEHISGRIDLIMPSGAHYLPRFEVPDAANSSKNDEFPVPLVLQDTDFWVVSDAVRYYFPAGTAPSFVIQPGSGSPTSGVADFSISGYFVNVP